jgi:hypothetical protein
VHELKPCRPERTGATRRPAALNPALVIASLGCILWNATAAAAPPEQSYSVTGVDTFSVGNGGDVQSQISYRGRETLSIEHERGKTLFVASARYTRVDQGASSDLTAGFSAESSADGEQSDLVDDDPDYLTVLKQPFAVALDAATMHDLAHLREDVPFTFPSPITGSTLEGRLRRIGGGLVSGMPALGVNFEAEGPMRGPLPDRPRLTMNGRIHMRGSAYYRTADALLVLLDATLTVSGNLTDPAQTDPVTIVYRRRIRADNLTNSP